jgi:predicted nucleotide-binding protein
MLFHQLTDTTLEDWAFTDQLLTAAIENLKLQDSMPSRKSPAGKRIFIGHGRSIDWKDLKDFLKERLNLEHEEFNREAVEGKSNKERLAEMLDNSCFAFIVMTAEDEAADGKQHARENVIHEAGLFQGKLGFERAIILLENGCEEFSNIHGLGQLRFKGGRITDVTEKIRAVLEREGIISPSH